jgi:hypothetical protein
MKRIGRETKVSYLRIVDGGRSSKPTEPEAGIYIEPGVFSAAEERIIRQRLIADAPKARR